MNKMSVFYDDKLKFCCNSDDSAKFVDIYRITQNSFITVFCAQKCVINAGRSVKMRFLLILSHSDALLLYIYFYFLLLSFLPSLFSSI